MYTETDQIGLWVWVCVCVCVLNERKIELSSNETMQCFRMWWLVNLDILSPKEHFFFCFGTDVSWIYFQCLIFVSNLFVLVYIECTAKRRCTKLSQFLHHNIPLVISLSLGRAERTHVSDVNVWKMWTRLDTHTIWLAFYFESMFLLLNPLVLAHLHIKSLTFICLSNLHISTTFVKKKTLLKMDDSEYNLSSPTILATSALTAVSSHQNHIHF